jgi:hypothetical protein
MPLLVTAEQVTGVMWEDKTLEVFLLETAREADTRVVRELDEARAHAQILPRLQNDLSLLVQE